MSLVSGCVATRTLLMCLSFLAFSDNILVTVYSGLPLTDFYAHTPYANEGPLDYWIRLNKAAEVAEQCLISKGEPMTDFSLHLVLMFIHHCADRELALVFKSKPSREWTARESTEPFGQVFKRKHCWAWPGRA